MNRKYTLQPTGPSPGSIDYERVLNPRQAEAVLHGEGPLLVVAGAGTGKTRTLVYRVARLVETGVPPGSILLLTFTRRASAEMLQRASVLLDRRCDQVAGGTFHSFANSVLRRHGKAIGLPDAFTILDRGDSAELVGLLRAEEAERLKGTRFPKKETLCDLFSRAVNRDETVEEAVEREAPHFLYCVEEIARVEGRYREEKRKRHLADYDDLLVLLVQLLRETPSVRRAVSETFRHVLVDEYQDTNRVQLEILTLLADAHDNVAAVGDDAQSIYAFRGARFRNLLDFPERFPGTKVVTLEENYRSRQPILDVTNEVIARAAEGYRKRLVALRGGGEPPALVAVPDERLQSVFVADRIAELHEEEGVPLSEMAVLFRAAYLSFDLEVELSKRHIPYRKYGGFRFLETAHVKDVVSHLRLLENPRDALSLSRALTLLPGLGKKRAAALAALAFEAASIEPVLASLEGKGKGEGEAASLASLLRELSSEPPPPVREAVSRVLAYYRPLLEARYDDWPRRVKDLEHLEALCARHATMGEFLTEVTLEPPQASVDDLAATDGEDDCLVLSTIHSAKGLEWKAVFLIWMLDGKLPSSRAADDPEEMEEERRLLYVAATRAKDRLVMTYPVNVYDRATGTVLSKPSRFVEEIAPRLLPRFALVE